MIFPLKLDRRIRVGAGLSYGYTDDIPELVQEDNEDGDVFADTLEIRKEVYTSPRLREGESWAEFAVQEDVWKAKRPIL